MDNKELIDIWKQHIDVQKHFNDLLIQVRERAITALGAGIVASAFLFKDSYVLTQPIRLVHITALILFALVLLLISSFKTFDKSFIRNASATTTQKSVTINNWFTTLFLPAFGIFLLYTLLKQASFFQNSKLYQYRIVDKPSLGGVALFALCLVWFAFYVMDRFWYHRLLKGAVNSSIPVETALFNQTIQSQSPPINIGTGLGAEISSSSSVYIFGKDKYFKQLRLDSTSKIDLFYVTIFIIIFSLASILIKNPDDMISSQGEAKAEFSQKRLESKVDSLTKVISIMKIGQQQKEQQQKEQQQKGQ